MYSVWKESFKINSFHVDFQKKIKPSVLMQFFQEAASNHAHHLGAGYQVLKERHLFWALSRITVEITRMPQWDEIIEFETWPCDLEGIFFRRDFQIYDKDHEIIVRGVSGWILLNSETLRPQRFSALGLSLPDNADKRALPTFPDRIDGITEEKIFSKRILFNEIDMNLHVNNTRDVDWVMDCFDYEHYSTHRLTRFSLEFLAETHWGDKIALFAGRNGEKHLVHAIKADNEKVAFKAETEWESAK